MRRLHLRDREGLLEHLVIDKISWVLIIGLTDSLCAVITVPFLWLLLWLTLVVLHALIRLHFLASPLRHTPCLLVVLPQGRVEIGGLTCRVENTRSLSSIVHGFVGGNSRPTLTPILRGLDIASHLFDFLRSSLCLHASARVLGLRIIRGPGRSIDYKLVVVYIYV